MSLANSAFLFHLLAKEFFNIVYVYKLLTWRYELSDLNYMTYIFYIRVLKVMFRMYSDFSTIACVHF